MSPRRVYPKIGQIINPAMDKIWVGDATAVDALADAVPQANEILAKELAKS